MSRQSNNLKSWDVQLHRNTFSICLWFKIFKVLYLPEIISKNQTYVKKVGPNRISFWHLLVNLKNKYLFKKVLKWANKKQNNFNIYNAALKKKKKINWWYHYLTTVYQKSWWYDLQFLRYRVWQTEISNFRPIHFWPFYPLTQKIKILKKWKKLLEILSFYTCLPKVTKTWCMVLETHSETHNFLSFCIIFSPFTPPTIHKIKNLIKWKKNLGILLVYTSVP